MIVSTQGSFWGRSLYLGAGKRVSEILARINKALLFLFTPEDTSGQKVAGRPQRVRYLRGDLSGVMKAMFWIAVSVLIVLWLGQLG